MKLTRTLAALGITVLTASGLALGAASGSAQSARVELDMPNCHNTIQGHVVDQLGRGVDDVDVRAFNLKNSTVPAASSMTYASPDNDIRHGYFSLCVGRGYYKIFMSKAGYKPAKHDKKMVTGLVWGGMTWSLGERVMNKNPEDTTTKVKLPATTTDADRETAKITVTAKTEDPSGKVSILVTGKGSKSKKQTVLDKRVSLDGGTATVKLPALEAPEPVCVKKKGKKVCSWPTKFYTWDVSVSYDGDDVTNASDASVTIDSYPDGREPK